MAITYEWSFPNFEVDGDNAVKTIHWRYTGSETISDTTYTASVYGSCTGSDMNFDDMTKQNAIDCVLENTDQTEADMQTSLSANIEGQKTPAVTSKTKEF